MAFPEVFGALQQKVIDAQENPLDVIYNDSIHEAAPYITLSNHVIGAFNFQFWGQKFKGFPQDVQDALKQAADAASAEYTANTAKREQEILDKYKANSKINHLSCPVKIPRFPHPSRCTRDGSLFQRGVEGIVGVPVHH